MAESLRFHPLVADDLEAATAWYDDISIEVGNRFRTAVDVRLDVFEHSSAATEVLGIFHSASDPNKWRARKR